MSNTSIHRAVWDWIKGCEPVTKLFFNFGSESNGATILDPSNERQTAYTGGAEEWAYTVKLVRFLPLTYDPNDDGNVTMLEDVDAISDWVQEQAAARDFPMFPDGCTVTEIKVMATQAGYDVAQNGLYAKYTVPFTIYYIKE